MQEATYHMGLNVYLYDAVCAFAMDLEVLWHIMAPLSRHKDERTMRSNRAGGGVVLHTIRSGPAALGSTLNKFESVAAPVTCPTLDASGHENYEGKTLGSMMRIDC